MTCKKVEDLIDNIDDKVVGQYKEYWSTMLPKTKYEYFNRWLYAMLTAAMSANSGNVLYTIAISNFPQWDVNAYFLTEQYRQAKVGFFNQKALYAFRLRRNYWADPDAFLKKDSEDWIEFRNRIASKTLGLGMAKGGFGVELTSPIEGGAVCLDRHMLRLYGQPPHIPDSLYRKLEQHWLKRCEQRGVPPCIARCAIWDNLQGYTDSTWWSNVLSPNALEEKTLTLTLTG